MELSAAAACSAWRVHGEHAELDALTLGMPGNIAIVDPLRNCVEILVRDIEELRPRRPLALGQDRVEDPISKRQVRRVGAEGIRLAFVRDLLDLADAAIRNLETGDVVPLSRGARRRGVGTRWPRRSGDHSVEHRCAGHRIDKRLPIRQSPRRAPNVALPERRDAAVVGDPET